MMIKQNGMVMMTEKELENLISDGNKRTVELETRNKMLRAALIEIIKSSNIDKKDVRVSKLDFIAIYNDALNEMFNNPDEDENDIYGYDITIHWHGIYCNCGDGATAYNHIITAIENVYNEDDEECIEYWTENLKDVND